MQQFKNEHLFAKQKLQLSYLNVSFNVADIHHRFYIITSSKMENYYVIVMSLIVIKDLSILLQLHLT